MYLLKYVLIIIIISSYSIGNYLPLSWGWENSPLEWSQVVILFAGALLTAKWSLEAKSAGRYHHARFFTWAIPLWLLMAGREMNWGRVFYPVGINPITGPFFIPVSQLPYGPIVYPLIAVVIFSWLFAVIKYKLFLVPYKLYQQGRFPTSEFLLVIFSFVVAHIAERQLHFEIMEEIVEDVAYISLILTAYRVKVALKNSINKIIDGKYFGSI
ncbi:hypothetical protein [Sporomusa acidovorans]|uniref:Uncharacterized protein n=1 Tax=Sporomusa acidovorans (strain ATCC 49682 / DSM 3132 / Mol) TaxID=1123286 RepID=A0ABZ3JAW1_SPOA4|nr:hypothetical protein [Sporomusa acidovorans]OZC18584.1 hypothetical protein SPACI_33050 [Sporomusa acidovorans DSM 3132]SDF52542.1 hypothetical protein SAMN04488499_105528 [Sporomusa acidovorans]